MTKRAHLIILCPRCGLGNRLRVMVSAIHFAQQKNLRLAHLWMKDSAFRFSFSFDDEKRGTGTCDFETLFEPISDFKAFVDEGQPVRLLSEYTDLCLQKGIKIVDENHNPGGVISEEHLYGVDAVLVLTSLSMPIDEGKKIELYQKYFTPRKKFLDILATKEKILKGNWLCVHLRTNHLMAYGFEEWNQEEVVLATAKVLKVHRFDRIIVFSDSLDAKKEFLNNRVNGTPIGSVEWETEDYVTNMFLDFLAMSRSSFILNTGLSSFSKEASMLGGGIPFHDIYQNRITKNN